MFLLGFKRTKDGYKFSTLSENGSKINSEIEYLDEDSYERIHLFLEDLRLYINSEGTFYATDFALKTKDKIQILTVEGRTPIGHVTGLAQVEIIFFHRNVDDWPHDTIEDNRSYLWAVQLNDLVDKYESLSEYVEQNFVHWSGLQSQLELLPGSKGVGVTFTSANQLACPTP